MTGHARSVESTLFRSYWDDGLLDVFAGIAVIGIAALWAVDLVVLGSIVPVVLIPFWSPLRRRVVEPRVGYVEFSESRTAGNRRWLASSAALGVVVLALVVSLYATVRNEPGEWLRVAAPGIPAVLLGVLAMLVSVGLGLPRFLVYSTVFCLGAFGVAVTASEPELAMFAGGVAIALNGARMMMRLLRIEARPEDAA